MKRKNAIERLYDVIEWSKEEFKRLKHKKYDWQSFHNGIIQYWSYLENKKIEYRKKIKDGK